ncbi:MAG: hypothetical protein NXI09_09640 [Bacteroidetes bacterium]|nr:hypothetical protein [Bacteroidota bacterium]
MKHPRIIIIGLALALGLLSIMGSAPEVHSPKERLYAKALQNGDSLERLVLREFMKLAK